MTFGDKLKQARIDAGLKQSDLANIIGTTNTTISNWEKGVSKPDLDMLSYICGALNVKASFFLQATLPDDEISVTEFNIIKKYRALDPHGREMVDFTLQKEWERSTHKFEEQMAYMYETRPLSIVAETGYEYGAIAAHNDHADEPGEQEKMLEDISNLKRPE